MLRSFRYLLLSAILIPIASCSGSDPSEIIFQNKAYVFVNEKTSGGGKFEIVRYSNKMGDIHLIVPHGPTDLDDFSAVYTNTFKAQGFAMSSNGNEHIGVGTSKMVYVTVSPGLDAISILLIDKTRYSKTTFEDASDIFPVLQNLS